MMNEVIKNVNTLLATSNSQYLVGGNLVANLSDDPKHPGAYIYAAISMETVSSLLVIGFLLYNYLSRSA